MSNERNKEDLHQFWEDRYLSNSTGWDLNGVTPVFEDIAKDLVKGKICILGCGRGYDALMFAQKGFEVTAVDFAPSAIESLKQLSKKTKNLNIVQQDIFSLKNKFEGYFDYILEQTCFCAINPKKRPEYARLVKSLLKKNGQLIGLWLPLDKQIEEGGPPYGTTVKEVKLYFGDNWLVEREEFSELSIDSRKNKEKLIIFKKIG